MKSNQVAIIAFSTLTLSLAASTLAIVLQFSGAPSSLAEAQSVTPSASSAPLR